MVICLAGESPESAQARTFRLDAAPWDNVGGARRGALRYAEDIINGTVPGVSMVTAR
ncbi:hypothetical protein D3C81_2019180 [compost metagenome]